MGRHRARHAKLRVVHDHILHMVWNWFAKSIHRRLVKKSAMLSALRRDKKGAVVLTHRLNTGQWLRWLLGSPGSQLLP